MNLPRPTHDPGPALRALHRPGDPFVLANAWDAGSARMLAALGARAIGTSSAAHAFTLGRPDGGVTRDEALAHAQILVAATRLPVSGDAENGWGDAPGDVAETVRLAAEAGLAGISIEDVHDGGIAYPLDLAVERVAAGAAAARALPRDFVFLARADGVMTGAYDLDAALDRVRRFDGAGADVLYVPVPGDGTALHRVVAATAKPVNALAVGLLAALSLGDFAALGVARVSLGSALSGVALAALRDAGGAILGRGDFRSLAGAMRGDESAAMLARGAG